MEVDQLSRRRWRRVAAGVVLMLVAPFVAPAPTASADPVTGITCTLGTFDVQIQPGVTLLEPRDLTNRAEYTFTNCLSLARPDIGSGQANFTYRLEDFTCLNLLEPLFDIDFTIQWNTNETSRVRVDQVVVGSVIVITGEVTSGLFAGKAYTQTNQAFTLDAARCLTTEGLTAVTGAIIEVDIT